MKKQEFYVYMYLDPRKPGKYQYPNLNICFLYEPFYVGKGKGLRMAEHLNRVKCGSKYIFNSFKSNKIKNILKEGLKPFILILKVNLTEEEAFILEKRTILNIGRSDLKLGPLCNFTDGGEGSSGRKHSEETKSKLRTKALGRKAKKTTIEKMRYNNSGARNPMYGKMSAMAGKTHTIESIKKMKKPKPKHFKQHLKGKNMPQKTKDKLSEAHKGIKAKPVDVCDFNWVILKKCKTTTEAGKYAGVDNKMVLTLIKNKEASKKKKLRFKYSND